MFSQVRRLVVVESTALFDTAGIDLKPYKAVKVKTKGTKTHTHTAGKEQNRCNTILSKYVCLFVCVQKVVYLEFPWPLYWIRTRGGFLGTECHSYCKG